MSEITDKQRAAWQWLNGKTSASLADRQALDALALLLPDALICPQFALPTEKGTTIYGGRDQPRTMFRIANGERRWVDENGECYTDDEARELMGEWDEKPPAQEQPTVTKAVIEDAYVARGLPGIFDLVGAVDA